MAAVPYDQAAIVQRYPDLRGCMRDRVVFLEGGSRTVPITEIRMPITLAEADALVARLRAPLITGRSTPIRSRWRLPGSACARSSGRPPWPRFLRGPRCRVGRRGFSADDEGQADRQAAQSGGRERAPVGGEGRPESRGCGLCRA